MRQIIVLEGPDGAGKTTLANHLVEKYGFRYHHEGPPKTKQLLQYYAGLVNEAHKTESGVVFDRLHLGETIYGPALRGKDLISENGLTLLCRLFRAYDVLTIYCDPGYAACRGVWEARYGQELVKSEEQLRTIYSAYEELADKIAVFSPFVQYDYNFGNLSTIYSSIETPSVTQINGVIGSLSSPYLFIGEKANHGWLDLPFFSTNGSSEFLNSCLIDAGYFEQDVSMMNARKIDGRPHNIRTAVLNSKPRHLICLGTVAWTQTLAAMQSVTHDVSWKIHKLHHPQYIKRFLGLRGREEYVEKLRAVREHS